MAAAYRSSTATNTGATTASSVVVSLPSGVQANDVLVAAVAVDGGSGSSITGVPSGWTVLANLSQSTNVRLAYYSRIATGYEQSTYTWTFDTNRYAAAVMVAYSGAHPFAPVALATNTTTSAATTINAAGANSTYETGRSIQFFATRNTTAQATITAGATYTKREDTCTTAGTFIELCVTDGAKVLPIGGLNPANATCSQAAVGAAISSMIEDARPALTVLDEDEFVVGSFSTARTTLNTSALQVNYHNTVLLAFIAINEDTATVSSITGGPGTWSLVARANSKAGSSEIWRSFAPTPTNTTFTLNYSTTVISGNIMFAGIIGADISGTGGSGAIGATNTGSSTAAAPSLAVSTTRDNSWVWAIANEGATNATTTAGTNQTILRNHIDATNAATSLMWRQNALTSTAGTSVTMNATSPNSADCNIAVVEIIPAVKKNLGTLGVG